MVENKSYSKNILRCCLVTKSRLTLCNPKDCSLPGSFVHSRILEWITTSSSRRSSLLRDQTSVSCISHTGGRFFTTEGFSGGSDSKSICLQCGTPGFNPWVRKIPWRRKWQPTPVLLPGKFYGWRSLVGYSPWGSKELDMTEQLHFHFSLFFTTEPPRRPILGCR